MPPPLPSENPQQQQPGQQAWGGDGGVITKLQLAAGLPPTGWELMEAAAEGGAAGGQQQQAVHDVWV